MTQFDSPEKSEDKLLGVQICEALNVPANRVANINISIPPPGQGPVHVELDVICIDGELDHIDWKEFLKDVNVTVIHTHCDCREEKFDRIGREAIDNLAPGAEITLTVSKRTRPSIQEWIDKHELKIISEEKIEYPPDMPDDIRKWNIRIVVVKEATPIECKEIAPSSEIIELSQKVVSLVNELESKITQEEIASGYNLRKRFSLRPLRASRALIFENLGTKRQREVATVRYFGGKWTAGYALDTLLCAMDYAGELDENRHLNDMPR